MEFVPSPRLKALAAALPYVDGRYRKNMALIIKMMEFKEICRQIDTMEATATVGPWKQNILAAMLPHVKEEKREGLQAMMQMMEMQEMFGNIDKLKEMNQWPN